MVGDRCQFFLLFWLLRFQVLRDRIPDDLAGISSLFDGLDSKIAHHFSLKAASKKNFCHWFYVLNYLKE